MHRLSARQAERARKNEQSLLQGLARAGQRPVADALGVHESTISRMKDGDIRRFAQLCAACGLKIVDERMKCYKPEVIESILTLAREHINEVRTADQLVWEEEV